MHVLIAPDTFKGSLSAKDAASYIEKGIKRVSPDIRATKIPLADGGEGTMESLVEATNGEMIYTKTHDPIGRQIEVGYGILGDHKTAVIELAEASGLTFLKLAERNPLTASTYGTGELIIHALGKGIRRFLICVGGSATNDAGTGILKALGFRFLDENGQELPEGGAALANLTTVDKSDMDPRLNESSFSIACDVTNPFFGKNGAAQVFAPQKGATKAMVSQLDQALSHFADIVKLQFSKEIAALPGAGAAGGTAGGLYALLGAEVQSGITLVLEKLQIESFLRANSIDLIITGEGKTDEQTADGKVIAGISSLGKRFNIPVIALSGVVEPSLDRLYEQGLTAAFSITTKPMTLEKSMAEAGHMLTFYAEQIARLLTVSSIYS